MVGIKRVRSGLPAVFIVRCEIAQRSSHKQNETALRRTLDWPMPAMLACMNRQPSAGHIVQVLGKRSVSGKGLVAMAHLGQRPMAAP